MMIANGIVRTVAQVAMKNSKLHPHYQEHQQMYIQRIRGFNNERSKL